MPGLPQSLLQPLQQSTGQMSILQRQTSPPGPVGGCSVAAQREGRASYEDVNASRMEAWCAAQAAASSQMQTNTVQAGLCPSSLSAALSTPSYGQDYYALQREEHEREQQRQRMQQQQLLRQQQQDQQLRMQLQCTQQTPSPSALPSSVFGLTSSPPPASSLPVNLQAFLQSAAQPTQQQTAQHSQVHTQHQMQQSQVQVAIAQLAQQQQEQVQGFDQKVNSWLHQQGVLAQQQQQTQQQIELLRQQQQQQHRQQALNATQARRVFDGQHQAACSALLPSGSGSLTAGLPGFDAPPSATAGLPGFAPALSQPAQTGESQHLRDQTNHLKSLLGL